MSKSSHEQLQSRLDFVQLDEEARGRLAHIRPLIDAHLVPALERFYGHIATVPAAARFFDGKPQMNRAQGKQVGHWGAIASGQLDANYFESSTRVGLRHAQIGLEPRWHIGGYSLIVETLMTGIITDYMTTALAPTKGAFGRSVPRDLKEVMKDVQVLTGALVSVLKAIMLDIDIGVSAYFEKLNDDTRKADDAAKAKIEAAVSAAGAVLQDVARGDLTTRVTAELEPEFDQIKHDTNAVAERLSTIVAQLQQTSRQMKVATSEILSGTNDLADRTTRQAATIEETTAAIEQLSTAVVENAKRAATASDKARSVAESATTGGEAITAANGAMGAIETSSSKISNIIGLIDDIAFQTNLLALNASVEAARAGEAGKGFAVVAVEVRRLAQSAANASSEVKALIETSAAEVRSGTQLVARAAEVLLDILAGAQESADLIDTIAQANRTQSAALEEVTVAVRQMDEMTQHNAALVEETNAAIEQTEAQASELDKIVDVFRIEGHQRLAAAPVSAVRRPKTPPKPAVRPLPKSHGNTALAQDWDEF
ncbi:MAG: methyl-accepting chemotaxis protein [Devosia sp.]|uniref:methyl-accepting chemotaxis protein n=1 Tax=Devosia sp. TaxID=1871048 RepID=UPI00339306B6